MNNQMIPAERSIRALAIGLILLAVPRASAQIAPADMRSGVASGVGTTTTSLFTVPVDSVFVLTDFSWTAGRPAAVLISSPPNISETQGGWAAALGLYTTGGPLRWSQWAFHAIHWYSQMDSLLECPCHGIPQWGSAGGVGRGAAATEDHSGPIDVHWTTGIVFGSGSGVDLSIAMTSWPYDPPVGWSASWSGYLVPSGFSTGLESSPKAESVPRFGSAPNPLRDDTRLSFNLSQPGAVTVAVFDVRGRRVRVLHEGEMEAGFHSLSWDGRDAKGNPVADGVYFARLITNEGEEVEKLIRLR
ncbi:MAG: T9SS type A sorting domain-containing protein [Candidatus Eisenbacteria bacterium]|nr:T9SS type A sorting domain-containing protein [Candidatus Eisenbacteria bacterium]